MDGGREGARPGWVWHPQDITVVVLDLTLNNCFWGCGWTTGGGFGLGGGRGGARLQAESCSEQGGGPDKAEGQAREGFGGGLRLQ